MGLSHHSQVNNLAMEDHIARPPTPQAMVHRLPDKPEDLALDFNKKPNKFIIIVVASNAVAGKLQIAKAVSGALACPLFQGDSLHESAAKAATVGVTGGANEDRYQRMWLSKMTRTGLLFPEESRAAGAGFSGFDGQSTSTSRRGSASSDASDFSSSDAASLAASSMSSGAPRHVNKPPTARLSEADAQRKANAALVLLTHPELESWQKACIKRCVAEYSIGTIFVPLDHGDGEDEGGEDEEELPILKPLDPSTLSSFGSLSGFGAQKQARNWAEEIVVKVDVDAKVDGLAEEVVEKVLGVMNE